VSAGRAVPGLATRGEAAGAATRGVSWHDRWRVLRTRWLADARFQRWAAGFPLTRGVARRRARALFDLCAGFVYSQVLFACVELGLLETLEAAPAGAVALARATGLEAAAMLRLLEAAAALGLVEARDDGCWGLGVHGAALRGNPGVAAMIAHHRLLYADLADPVALLRGERDCALARYWAYARTATPAALAPAAVDAYTTLMAESQSLVADDVLEAYPLGRHACLLDVGGGDGSFVRAALARTPGLRGIVFDLPPVARRAGECLAAAGLGRRARAQGGDFRSEALPAGADVISLVRVLHDHDDETVRALLGAARRALPAGGVLVVAEPFAGQRGAETVGAAYFGFYLLAMGRGRARTAAELTAFLREAGFLAVRERATRRPLQCGVLTAIRGAAD